MSCNSQDSNKDYVGQWSANFLKKCMHLSLFILFIKTYTHTHTYIYIYIKWEKLALKSVWSTIISVINIIIININIHTLAVHYLGLVGRVFANGLGDLGSIPGRVIPKTLKMVLDTSLLNTQQYKVYIKGKVEQSRERSSAFSYTSVL